MVFKLVTVETTINTNHIRPTPFLNHGVLQEVQTSSPGPKFRKRQLRVQYPNIFEMLETQTIKTCFFWGAEKGAKAPSKLDQTTQRCKFRIRICQKRHIKETWNKNINPPQNGASSLDCYGRVRFHSNAFVPSLPINSQAFQNPSQLPVTQKPKPYHKKWEY